MDGKPNNVNKFWLSYRDAVVSSGIAEKAAEWYVHWAQEFAVSMKGKGLRSRSSKDVHSFLNQLEGQDGVEQWQVEMDYGEWTHDLPETADNSFLGHREKTSQGWGYCVFGRVEGMKVVDAIESLPTTVKAWRRDVPISPVVIERAVLEK